MTPEKAFSKVLREIRNEHSLSQEELGFESGYHRTYISLLERRRKSLPLNTIFRSLVTARLHLQDSGHMFANERRAMLVAGGSFRPARKTISENNIVIATNQPMRLSKDTFSKK
jgi:transcriptional regulator with XRE-family HTH domain